MGNRVIWCVVLLPIAATACNRVSKLIEPGNALQELAVDLGDGVKLEMVLIPAGEYMMGSGESTQDIAAFQKNTTGVDVPSEAFNGEHPQHRVRITKPFYLGKYEVTQEQWEAVMGSNPSEFKGAKNPVEQVSWENCRDFLNKLNEKVGGKPGKFVLPTEAQWEYACRAGSTTRFCFGDDANQLRQYAYYGCEQSFTTHRVGEKKPNAFGLYDMHGNVFEMCQDWYSDDYFSKSPTDDPIGPDFGTDRVCRGGSWLYEALYSRSAVRRRVKPDFLHHGSGFRVSMTP